MFYNTENFFDTIDDPHKTDNEFLPGSKLKWNTKKYFNKIKRISSVIDSVGGPDFPTLVGMCEVENETCIKDLIAFSVLKKCNYGYLVTNSPDVRSIDVALLFDKDQFTLKSHKEISATNPDLPENKTRNILHAVLQSKTKELIHVFVNHWPSMIGGEAESEPRRIYAAAQLRKCIDSLLKNNVDTKILVMGDFNETPDKKAVREILGAQEINVQQAHMFNPFASLAVAGQGTHYYKNEWSVLDQIIISPAFYKNSKLHYKHNSAAIFKHDMVLYTAPKKLVKYPNRTFKGTKYFNGYSDHLPVYLILTQQ